MDLTERRRTVLGSRILSWSNRHMATKKKSLVANINRKKENGTSKSKEDSTVTPKAYSDMQKGWPKPGRKKT